MKEVLMSMQGNVLCCPDGDEDTLGRRRERSFGNLGQDYAKVWSLHVRVNEF